MPLDSFEPLDEPEAGAPALRPSLEQLLRRQHVTSLTKELDLSYAYDMTAATLGTLIELLPQLVKLVIRDTGLRTLPNNLHRLGLLREVDLSGNQLAELPASFARLERLQHANLSRNALKKLDDNMAQLKRLRLLNLNHNELESIPPAVGELSQLRVLRLGANKLSNLPREMAALRELRLLQLAYNQLPELPPLCTGLKRLRVLDIAHNQLSTLPDEVRHQASLLSLNVTGNPLDFGGRTPSFAQNIKVLGLPGADTNLAVESVVGQQDAKRPAELMPHDRPDLTGIYLAGLDEPQTATGTFLVGELEDERTEPEGIIDPSTLEGDDALGGQQRRRVQPTTKRRL